MKKVILIGTIHLHFTPKGELLEAIKLYKPDKVLIELTDKEVKQGADKSNRDEMFVVLDYVVKENIPYSLFDIDDSILKEGVSGSEPEFVEYEQKVTKLLSEFSWKDLNNADVWLRNDIKKNEDFLLDTFFDKEKLRTRENKIGKNIISELVDGVNVVITGAGHITHLLRDIPSSEAPFRSTQ